MKKAFTDTTKLSTRTSDFITENNGTESLVLKNDIDDVYFQCKIIPNLSLFKTYFKSTGHSISIPLYKSFTTLPFFDIDCVKCKNGTCTIKFCSYGFCVSLSSIFQTFCKPLPVKAVLVFTRPDYCGAHVYCISDYSVDLIFYETIIDTVNEYFSQHAMDHIIVDKVTNMPLPYSAKNDDYIYMPIMDYPDNLSFCIAPSYFGYKISNTNNITSSSLIVAELKTKRPKASKDRYFPDMELVDLIENKCIVRSEHVELFKDIPNETAIILKLPNLSSLHINIAKLTAQKKDDKTKPFIDFDQSSIDSDVFQLFTTLGKKLVSFFNYDSESDSSTICVVCHLLSTPNDSFGNCFHIIGSLLEILYTQYKRINGEYNYEKFITYRESLRYIIIKIYPNQHLLFQHIFKKLENINDPNFITNNYTQSLNIIKYISYQRLLASYNFSIHDLILSHTLNLPDEELVKSTIKLLKIIYHIIYIPSKNKNIYYWFNGSLYCKISDLKKLAYVEYIHGVLKTKLKQGADIVMLRIIQEFQTTIKPFRRFFNDTRHFINCSIGLFNSPIGIYMDKLPQFYYADPPRDHAVISRASLHAINIDEPIEILEENNTIISELPIWSSVFKTIFSQPLVPFVCGVILPGLFTLENFFCTDKEYSDILDIIIPYITSSTIEHFKLLFYHFKFRTDTICKMLRCIDHGLINDNTFSFKLEKLKSIWHHIYSLSPCEDTSEIFLDFGNRDKELVIVAYCFCIIFHESDHIRFSQDTSKVYPEEVKYEIGAHFNYDKFIYLNQTCVCNMLQQVYTFIPDYLIEPIVSLLIITAYDVVKLKKFIETTSLLYLNGNDNKRFLLIIGKKNSGKTFTVAIMTRFMKQCIVPMTGSLGKMVAERPNPLMCQAFSSVMLLINEANFLDTSALKTITGNDPQSLRELYENTPIKCLPTTFIVVVSNIIPKLKNIDEAIRVRMHPVVFKYSVVSKPHDNALISFNRKQLASMPQLKVEDSAWLLLVFQYITYSKIHDKFGNIKIPPLDEDSLTIVEDIMQTNEPIYRHLANMKIGFDPKLYITKLELERIVLDYFDSKPDEPVIFMEKFNRLFFDFADNTNGNIGYSGIGILNRVEHIEGFNLVYDESSKITFRELKTLIKTKETDPKKRDNLFSEMKIKYEDFIVGNAILKHRV